MKITSKILLICLALGFSSCEKFLDRPPLTSENDETAWSSEEKLRLYTNKYYTDFFTGYGNGFSTGGAPLVGFTNHDDFVVQGNQPNFTRSVPTSSIWSYSTIRSLNIMINRIEERMGGVLSPAAKNHWLGVGKFFRSMEYADLARTYGDVPYIDRIVGDSDEEELYKPRDPRNKVMDAVYEDWKFALENVRLADGDQSVNRYIVAAFVSRLALYEGTWQKYYYNNAERAQRFLKLAQEASEMVINSGKYAIVTDYRTLFTSKELKGNRDIILYRNYDAAVGVTHAIASNSNLQESTLNGPTTALLKSYLLNDGTVWESSSLSGAKSFDIENMIKTRDSRFEATFYSKPDLLNRGSLYYVNKFFPREVEISVKENGGAMPAEYTGDKNDTDAPVMRYAEVLLNFIEAKAELATLGGAVVSQSDIDKTINEIRNRPLAKQAIDRGVKKTTPLNLGAIPFDPSRDSSVPELIWEIRRERRVEFAFEIFRLNDLRRWSKLEYMDNNLNPDLMSGGWVNFPTQLSAELATKNVGILSVADVNGKVTVYNGNNASVMVGFFKNQNNKPRLPFLNQPNVNPYLTPVGINQMDAYALRGYVLQQTQGWSQN